MWCHGCYESKNEDGFPRRALMDEGGRTVEDQDDGSRFMFGRGGDQFMLRFQCDMCHFQNIKGRDPVPTNGLDDKILRSIRRANLDAMWAREPSTVDTNRRQVKEMVLLSARMYGGDSSIMPEMGPNEVSDVQGMGLATLLLEKSLKRGRTESTLQFDTVRKWRSSHSSLWHASVKGLEDSVAVRGVGKLVSSTAPANGPWFERFMEGLHKRMGDKSEPDLAMSIELVLEILRKCEAQLTEGERRKNAQSILEALRIGTFVSVGFCGGLRGEEIMLMDVCGMMRHRAEGNSHKVPHTVIALLGKFKGETGQRYHYMPMAKESRSGIKLDFWVGKFLGWYHERGIREGHLMRSENGSRLRASHLSMPLFRILKEIQFERPDLIPSEVEVDEEFGMGRSLRRGSNSQAINAGLRKEVIDRNNRWRKFERSKGRNPRLEMQEHYADARLIVGALVEYSQSL